MGTKITTEMIREAVREYLAEVERLKGIESSLRNVTGAVDPAEAVASVGPAEVVAEVGAVEVGGAGTGAWIWVSAAFGAFPISSWIVAAVLVGTLGLSLFQGTIWALHKFGPHASEKQIDAQYEIVNNPLHDQPQHYTEALGGDEKQAKPGSNQNQRPSPIPPTSSIDDQDYKIFAGLWGNCKREWHGPDDVLQGDPGILNAATPTIKVHSRAPWQYLGSHRGVYITYPVDDDTDMRVSENGLPMIANSTSASTCTFFMSALVYCTKSSGSHFECHGGSNIGNNKTLGEQYRSSWDIAGRTMTIQYHQPSNNHPNSSLDDAGDAVITLTKKKDYICPAPRNGCSQCFDATTREPVPKPVDCS